MAGEKVRVKMIDAPFNYEHPGNRRVTVIREKGPCMLPPNLARAAIDQGYAVPFEPAGAIVPFELDDEDAEDDAADESEPDFMDRANDAHDDRPADVDPADVDSE